MPRLLDDLVDNGLLGPSGPVTAVEERPARGKVPAGMADIRVVGCEVSARWANACLAEVALG